MYRCAQDIHFLNTGSLDISSTGSLNLNKYLNSSFCKIQPQGELLPGEHVRVLGLLEAPLQLVELERRERRPRSTNLSRFVAVLELALLVTQGIVAEPRILFFEGFFGVIIDFS